MTRLTITLSLALTAFLAVSPAEADEPVAKPSDSQAMRMALPESNLLKLTLLEGDETHTFTMTVASRHFTMALGEKNIKLVGMIWGGGEKARILEYTLEFSQWIDDDPGRKRVGSTWNGSTYIRDGEPVEVVRFLGGAFSIELTKID